MVTLTNDSENKSKSDFTDLLSNKCLQAEMPRVL